MEKKLAVIVLNYRNYQDTIDCVESLLNQDYRHCNIVIVENGSKNESFNVLQNIFGTIENIKILKTEKNLGFAKGNNLGILYAKNTLQCRYIFILNNDTILTANNILSQLMVDQLPNVALVSPILIGNDGKQIIGHNWEKNRIVINTIIAIAYTMFQLMPANIKENFIKIKRKICKQKRMDSSENTFKQNQYQIQGAAFLLTPVFFNYYKILYPRTFLYCEEINMSWYLHKAKLSTMVINTNIIFHKEAKSTTDTIIKMKTKLVMNSFLKSIIMYFSSYEQIIKNFSENKD